MICAVLLAHLQRIYGWSADFAVQATYCSLLLLIAVIDLEHSIVPNVLVGCGVLLVVAFNAFYPTPGLAAALWGAAAGGGVFLFCQPCPSSLFLLVVRAAHFWKIRSFPGPPFRVASRLLLKCARPFAAVPSRGDGLP